LASNRISLGYDDENNNVDDENKFESDDETKEESKKGKLLD